jgi:hypothetical protein
LVRSALVRMQCARSGWCPLKPCRFISLATMRLRVGRVARW